MKTKITFLTIALFGLLSTQLMAQAKLGDNPTNVNPNVLLELESSDKGLLIPRLTSSERDSAFTTNIPNGLMIYNTTEDCLQVYKDGSGNWDCIEGTSGGVLTREGNVLRINNSNVDLSELLQLNLDAGDTNTSLLQLGDSQIILKEGTNIRLTEKDNILTITASGQGPAGPAGPQGPPGPQGPQGIQGSEGTDSQTLTLSGTILSISGGNSVTLATASGSNTDSQTLSFGSATTTQTTLKLRNDPNPLSIQTSGSLSLSQTDSHTLELIGGGQLIQITENGKTGYRLANFDPSKHGNIGTGAIDLSYQEYNSNSKGASGTHAFAAGDGTSAYGNYSVAMGQITSANDFSSAMGYNNKARGSYSLAMGYSNIASGTYSVALGGNNIALQDFTTVLGWGNKAQSRDEMVVGRFNTEYNPKNPTGWSPDDRLFVIGNGLGRAIRSDALVVLKNGNTGLGTSTPTATLHVSGTLRFVDGNQGANKVLTSDANGMASWQTPSGGGGTGTDSQTLSVSSGTTSTSVLNLTASTSVTFEAGNNIVLNEDLQNNTIIISATGSLTAGTDDQNLSVGAGTATTSLIQIETGAGITLEAGENIRLSEPTSSTIRIAAAAGQLRSLTETNTGYRLANESINHGPIGSDALDLSIQTASPFQKGATGQYAVAMGFLTTASEFSSTAIGYNTSASGYFSTALGENTTAESYGQTALGIYNTPHPGNPNATNISEEDRLLVIGNGTGSLTTSRSDALVMLKNGNTELNGALTLDAANDGTGYTLPTAKGTAGQVLTMDNAGTGTTIWTTISGGSGGNPTLSLVGDVLSISGTSSVSLAAYNDSGTDTQTLSVGAGDANTSLIQIQNGNEVTFEAGNNIVLNEDLQNNTIIISATGSLTAGTDDQNLSVGAGTATTSLIQIETGAGITLEAGENIRLSEPTSSTIRIAAENPLISVTESNTTGYRLADANSDNHGNIGTGAIDLSYQEYSTTDYPEYGTGATGDYAFASGRNTTASGNYSTAMGGSTASGLNSTAMGGSNASGGSSIAMGVNATASGNYSFASGYYSTASGDYSTAMGWNTTASGDDSTAMGSNSTASGFASTAMGSGTAASGRYSTAMGLRTTAETYGQTTLGLYNTPETGKADERVDEDRLLVIGNGTGSLTTSRSDALVMLKNGNTELNGALTLDTANDGTGYTLPTAKGTAGQVLTMDNASTGTTIWTTISGGSGGSPTLSLVGDVLSISGTSSVSLAAYNDSGTDTQTLSVGAGDANTSLIQIQNGNEVTFEAGNNIVLSENTTNNTIQISATGSLTAGTDDQNLSVGAGDTDTSLIQIEGGDPITLQAGDNISLTESGTTITLNATGGGGGSGGGTLTGLVSITQGNFSGYRLAEEHLLGNHDPIGQKAVDLSKQSFDDQNNLNGATGTNALAMGTNTAATAERSTAIGTLSRATATESIAIGNVHHMDDGFFGPQATGNYSMAFGGASVASGERSITMGTLVTAESYGQTTLGLFNTKHPNSPSTTSWQATDRLFVIGNGKDAFDTSDALVMLKNGDTTLNGNLALTTGHSISVEGTTLNVPDYVFESYFDGVSEFNKAYRLPSLSEVATFIKENKHLPGVQSRADIQKAGSWDVTENVRTNLEKVEELYLYTIEQENQIQSQSQQLEQQNRLIHQLLERIETLEKKME